MVKFPFGAKTQRSRRRRSAAAVSQNLRSAAALIFDNLSNCLKAAVFVTVALKAVALIFEFLI